MGIDPARFLILPVRLGRGWVAQETLHAVSAREHEAFPNRNADTAPTERATRTLRAPARTQIPDKFIF